MARIFIVALFAVAGAIQLAWGYFCDKPLVPFISSWLHSKGYSQMNINFIIGLLFILVALLVWKFSKPKSKPEPKDQPDSDLEIEGVTCETKHSGNSRTVCQILVRNKHPNIQAKNVKVTLLEMEFSPENKPGLSQVFPLVLKPETNDEKPINAGDELKFTLFYIEPSDPKIVACFQPNGNRDKRWLLFEANTNYAARRF